MSGADRGAGGRWPASSWRSTQSEWGSQVLTGRTGMTTWPGAVRALPTTAAGRPTPAGGRRPAPVSRAQRSRQAPAHAGCRGRHPRLHSSRRAGSATHRHACLPARPTLLQVPLQGCVGRLVAGVHLPVFHHAGADSQGGGRRGWQAWPMGVARTASGGGARHGAAPVRPSGLAPPWRRLRAAWQPETMFPPGCAGAGDGTPAAQHTCQRIPFAGWLQVVVEVPTRSWSPNMVPD